MCNVDLRLTYSSFTRSCYVSLDHLTAIFQLHNIPASLNSRVAGNCEFKGKCKEPILIILRL